MLTIRPLKETDSAREIGNLLGQLTSGRCQTLDFKAVLASSTRCLVVVNEDKIIGFGSLISYYLPTVGEIGRIEDVIIDQNYRGQGLGKKLLEAILEVAKQNKLLRVELTSNPKRIAARCLYAQLRFATKDTDVFVKELE